MSGPHGADPAQGDGFAEQPTTQTPAKTKAITTLN